MKEKGYQYNHEKGMSNWMVKYTTNLNKKGYTHNRVASAQTGGDNDFLVIDHKLKQYCFWENGFWPFCYSEKIFPVSKNLTYWATHRE